MHKQGNVMPQQQVITFWEYRKSDSIFGFPNLKLAGMQIFEFLTQVHQQKLNFDPIYPYAQM